MLKKDDYSSVAGKVVVVTGGTSGIGRSMVELFAANGAKVVFGARKEERGIKFAEELTAQGADVIFKRTDTSVEEDVKALINTAVEHYGQLHVLCNNAGVIPRDGLKPAHEIEVSELKRLIDINVWGYFYGIKHGVRAMLETKSTGCSIINTASTCGLRATEGFLPYDLTKHAIVGLTKTAALDYAKHDITVNAICPGSVKTGIHDGQSEEQLAIVASNSPVGRMGKPEEIAYMALFLATDHARFITGSQIVIDGGLYAGDRSGDATVWSKPDPRF